MGHDKTRNPTHQICRTRIATPKQMDFSKSRDGNDAEGKWTLTPNTIQLGDPLLPWGKGWYGPSQEWLHIC